MKLRNSVTKLGKKQKRLFLLLFLLGLFGGSFLHKTLYFKGLVARTGIEPVFQTQWLKVV